MRILEELWYGNIEPTEYATAHSKEYRELRRLIDRNEEKQKELFAKYVECAQDCQTLAECMLFQNSFKLGVRMMAEVMVE